MSLSIYFPGSNDPADEYLQIHKGIVQPVIIYNGEKHYAIDAVDVHLDADQKKHVIEHMGFCMENTPTLYVNRCSMSEIRQAVESVFENQYEDSLPTIKLIRLDAGDVNRSEAFTGTMKVYAALVEYEKRLFYVRVIKDTVGNNGELSIDPDTDWQTVAYIRDELLRQGYLSEFVSNYDLSIIELFMI